MPLLGGLTAVTQNYRTCLVAATSWLNRIGCAVGYDANVVYALGRFGLTLAPHVIQATYNLVMTAISTSQAADQVSAWNSGTRQFTIAAASGTTAQGGGSGSSSGGSGAGPASATVTSSSGQLLVQLSNFPRGTTYYFCHAGSGYPTGGTIASHGSVDVTSSGQYLSAMCSGSGNFWIGFQATDGHDYYSNQVTLTAAAEPPYQAGRQVTIDNHATGGVSGHTGPGNSYPAGPTRPVNSALGIVCYVNGQSITGPYDTTTLWDLADDGYYYTDAWLFTGINGPAVPPCAMKTVTVDSHATGGVSGHTGPGNSYAAGPTHAANTAITIVCYVNGQSITGPYDTTTLWDLADDGYYYTDAWLFTGINGPAVPAC